MEYEIDQATTEECQIVQKRIQQSSEYRETVSFIHWPFRPFITSREHRMNVFGLEISVKSISGLSGSLNTKQVFAFEVTEYDPRMGSTKFKIAILTVPL